MFWQAAYGELTEAEQEKFLAKEEVNYLSTQNEELVESTIKKEKKLYRIVEIVKNEVRPETHFEYPTSEPIRNESRERHSYLRCKDCNQLLVLKKNTHEEKYFWGCTNFRMNAYKGFCKIAVPT